MNKVFALPITYRCVGDRVGVSRAIACGEQGFSGAVHVTTTTPRRDCPTSRGFFPAVASVSGCTGTVDW